VPYLAFCQRLPPQPWITQVRYKNTGALPSICKRLPPQPWISQVRYEQPLFLCQPARILLLALQGDCGKPKYWFFFTLRGCAELVEMKIWVAISHEGREAPFSPPPPLAECSTFPITPRIHNVFFCPAGWLREAFRSLQVMSVERPPPPLLLSCCLGRVSQNHTFIGIYGAHTLFLARKSPYIRSYTVQIYGSGQPYV